jgi:hypothetical protein
VSTVCSARRTAVLVPLAVVALTGTLTACGGSAGSAAAGTVAGTSSSAAPARLDVGIEGGRFTGVRPTVAPGTVTLAFANSTTAVHMAAIGRLAAGHTAGEIPAYLASPAGAHGLPPWLSLVGGVDEIDPGHRGSWTGTLGAGQYALVSFSPDAHGVPDAAAGLLAPFAVAGKPAPGGPAPSVGATVTLGSGATLKMTRLPAGTTGLKLVNDDTTPRTVDITAIKPGSTFADVMREAQSGQGVPPSLIRLGGSAVPAHGSVVAGIEAAGAGTTYVVFDIEHVGDGAIASVTAG